MAVTGFQSARGTETALDALTEGNLQEFIILLDFYPAPSRKQALGRLHQKSIQYT